MTDYDDRTASQWSEVRRALPAPERIFVASRI